MRLFIFSLIALVLAFHSNAQLPPPDHYILLQDEVYKTVGDWKGRMDIYSPKDSSIARPLVIFIHGGGWVHGQKETEKEYAMFFDDDMIVVNIEYRLAKVAPAPAAIEDCRCALIYLLENSKRFNIDTKRIVIMGISAGAHLALMTGLLANDHRFDKDCSYKEKINIAGIVNKSGITDVNRWDRISKPTSASADWIGERYKDTVFINTLSPISYVNKKSAPVLTIHGDKDNTVPVQQAYTLDEKLKKAKVETQMLIVPGGAHSFSKQEDKNLIRKTIMQFVREKVGKSGSREVRKPAR